MGDVVKPFGQWISENIPLFVGILLFIFCVFFEISKIKIYPLKWLWKSISWPFKKIDEQRTGSFKNLIENLKSDIDTKLLDMSKSSEANCAAVKSCFTNLEKRFDKLDEKQQETEERLDLLAAARIKNHVLNFARQCRQNIPHSHEDFVFLFQENAEYQALVKRYHWDNDVYKHDYAYILRVYDEQDFKE